MTVNLRKLVRTFPGFLRTAGVAALLGLAAPALGQTLPQGPGVDLVYAKCQICHDLTYLVDTAGVDAATWEGILTDMIDFGAPVNEDEREVILNYLSTYLGPNPPAEEAPAETPEAAAIDAAQVYATNCAGCHQPDGKGLAGVFPPLANNPALVRDPSYPARVVLFGLSGEIQVGEETYSGAMPAVAHLDDATVAALVNYLLQTFNAELLPEDFEPLRPEQVAELRASPLEAKEVLKHRPAAGP